MLRVVVDTSVFVAGYLTKSTTSLAAQIIARWRSGDFCLIMSRQILEEIVAKFIEKGISEDRILEFVKAIGSLALNVPGNYVVYRLDDVDPDDNMLLAAAQEGGADYLVSLDAKHVLPLKYHHGTQIVTPTIFISILNRELNAEDEEAEETDEQRHERLFKAELEEVLKEKRTGAVEE